MRGPTPRGVPDSVRLRVDWPPRPEERESTDLEVSMAKGQVNKGKKNKAKLSVKEKKARKKEKKAAKGK